MLAKIFSGATIGLDALPVEVEVDVASRGLVSLTVVGLPDKAVQEAKERVRAALDNAGCSFPAKRITVNLAPADLPKQGPAYDLPIALGILLASGEIEAQVEDSVFLGELSLDGSVRRVSGSLPLTLMAKQQGFKKIFLPADNAHEASVVDGVEIYGVLSLQELIDHLTGKSPLSKVAHKDISSFLSHAQAEIDFHDIAGQEQAKRACEIAAAGGHNLFLSGVPGAGKTLLARAFAGILPTLTQSEALEVTKIYSIAGLMEKDQSIIARRPFRSPHHTISLIGAIGGGSYPKPGEISLAHRGVLFLDEFPEFPRSVLESLRSPLEDGKVQISRAAQTNVYPCRFILVAAANPCPCGNLGSPKLHCSCSVAQINRYKAKISGPILDRIDLHLTVAAVEVEKLQTSGITTETSQTVRTRVQKARDIQSARFAHSKCTANGEMSTRSVKKYCQLDPESVSFLNTAANKLNISARSYFKTIKVARTIADLAQCEEIAQPHLAEALQYRPKLVHA
jgi:magnesium chelatase family protein